MRYILFAGLLAFLGFFAAPANAQGVTRVCVQSIGANGSNNCVDISTTNPAPVACISGCSAAGGTGANNADGVPAVGTGLGLVQSYPFLWNGATFDRWKGDTTSGAWVNIKNASLAVTGTFWQATQPVSAASLPLPTGAAQGAVANAFSLIAAASTNSTSVKGSAGTRGSVSVYSISSTAVAWLKIYDTASAPTCGTGTPKERHLISYGASGAGGGAVMPSDQGVTYSSGIGICITGGIADADTTAVAASTFVVNMNYR